MLIRRRAVRRLMVLTAALVFLLQAGIASEAHACIPEPPAPWSTVLVEGGPTVLIGQVVKVELAERPRASGAFLITEATATIRSLEAVQGGPVADARVSGAVRVRNARPDAPMFCGDFLGLQAGDLVLAVRRADGSFRTHPLEKLNLEQIDDPGLRKKLEAYR